MRALNILLVDDEPMILAVFAEALADAGHRVTAVAGAGDALRALAAGAFDVALLDQCLGTSRGVDLMREMAARDPGVRFLIMSGAADRELEAEALGAGAAAVLAKPIPGDELARGLERAAAAQARECGPGNPGRGERT